MGFGSILRSPALAGVLGLAPTVVHAQAPGPLFRPDTALFAESVLHIGAESTLAGGAEAGVGSRGSTTIGARSTVEGVVSGDRVEIAQRARVSGAVVATGGVRLGLGATVEGPIERAAAALPGLPLPDVDAAPDEGRDLVVRGWHSIAGGAYGDIVVTAGSTLILKGGRIDAARLVVEDDAQLWAAYPTEVHLAGGFTLGHGAWVRPMFEARRPDDLRIAVGGGTMVWLGEARFEGSLSAPQAAVFTASDLAFTGSLMARQIWLADGADLEWHPPCSPVPEVCNGQDDDCDDRVDEGLVAPPADHGVGVCVDAVQICRGVRGWQEPLYLALAGYEPDEGSCDRVDNDCDGHVDEHVDLARDPENCGWCGRSCITELEGPATCRGGACFGSCLTLLDCEPRTHCAATGYCAPLVEDYLKASNAGGGDRWGNPPGDHFGTAVAAGEGVVVVGAPLEDGDANSTVDDPNDLSPSAGAAYVFEQQPNGEWRQVAYLKRPPDGEDTQLGRAVALHGDLIVVGAAGQRTFGDAGTVYLFARGQDGWSLANQLRADNRHRRDEFGQAVAMSPGRIVVGAPAEDGDASSTSEQPNQGAGSSGAVYVFDQQPDGEWLQTAYLKAANAGAGDRFGSSVDIHGDRIVVGAPWEDGDAASTADAPNDEGDQSGALYVFDRQPDGRWQQTAYIKTPAALYSEQDKLGQVVAVRGDTIYAGVPYEEGDRHSTLDVPNDARFLAGAVFTFDRAADGRWSLTQYIKGRSRGTTGGFGTSLAISPERLYVGAPLDGRPNQAGAIYAFTRSADGQWVEEGYILHPGRTTGDNYGQSIALVGDVLFVGTPDDDGDADGTLERPGFANYDSGAVFVHAFYE